MQTRTRGGDSETGQKALSVSPRGRPPSSCAVTMATPVGKQAMMSLNRSALIDTAAKGTIRCVFEVSEFVPAAATREEWTRYHAFRRRQHEELGRDEPPTPDHLAEVELLRENPYA